MERSNKNTKVKEEANTSASRENSASEGEEASGPSRRGETQTTTTENAKCYKFTPGVGWVATDDIPLDDFDTYSYKILDLRTGFYREVTPDDPVTQRNSQRNTPQSRYFKRVVDSTSSQEGPSTSGNSQGNTPQSKYFKRVIVDPTPFNMNSEQEKRTYNKFGIPNNLSSRGPNTSGIRMSYTNIENNRESEYTLCPQRPRTLRALRPGILRLKINFVLDVITPSHSINASHLLMAPRRTRMHILFSDKSRNLYSELVGTLRTSQFRLENTLFVPDLPYNVMSVEAITQDGGNLVFTNKKVTLRKDGIMVDGYKDDAGYYRIDLDLI